jgi:hypothetical protein
MADPPLRKELFTAAACVSVGVVLTIVTMWLEYILIVPNDCSSKLFQLVIVEYIIFYLLCALQ